MRFRCPSLILLSTLLPCCVGAPPASGLWVLPPSEPRGLDALAVPRPAAAVGSALALPSPAIVPSAPAAGAAVGDVEGGPVDPAPQASSAHPLELRELLQVVARTYPALDIAEQRRVLARARQLAALGGFDVMLKGYANSQIEGFYENDTAGVFAEQPTGLWGTTVYGGYRVGNGLFDPTFDGKRLTNDGGEFSAGVRVPLLRGGATDTRRRAVWAADIERDLADADAATLRLQATLGASQAYWWWVAAGQGLVVTEALLQLAEQRRAGIESRVRAGDLPDIEQVDNERLVVARRALLVKARRAVEKAAIALSLFLRDSAGEPRRPEFDELLREFPPVQAPRRDMLEGDLRLALEQRPEMLRLIRERRLLLVDREFFANSSLPQLDLTVEGSRDLDRFDPTPTKGEFELFVGVEMSVPIQNRAASGKVAAVDAKLAELAQKTRFQQDKIVAEVRDDFSELEADFERAAQSLRAAELADQLAAGELRKFEAGASTVLILNLREEAATEARLRYLSVVRDYWIAVSHYRASVGEDPTQRRKSP